MYTYIIINIKMKIISQLQTFIHIKGIFFINHYLLIVMHFITEKPSSHVHYIIIGTSYGWRVIQWDKNTQYKTITRQSSSYM